METDTRVELDLASWRGCGRKRQHPSYVLLFIIIIIIISDLARNRE